MKKDWVVLCLIIGCCFSSLAQNRSANQRIDSLNQVIKTAKHDTIKINALITLSSEYLYSNTDTAYLLAEQTMKLAKAIHYKKGMAGSLNNIGNVYWNQGNYPKAREYYFKALKINEVLDNKKGIAINLGNIGNVYTIQGDFPKVLEYYFKALKINEELDNKRGIALNLGNIGNVYKMQDDHPKVLEYLFKALKINEELDNKSGIARNLGNIGIEYKNQGDYPKALEYYFEALKINEELDNKRGIASNLSNIGNVYVIQSDHPKALEYFFKALKINETIGNKRGIAINLGNIGDAHNSLKDYKEAENYLQRALLLADNIGDIYMQHVWHLNLSKLSRQTHRWQKAYEHYRQYSTLKDSVFNKEKSQDIGRLEAKAEYDKQQAVATAEHQKELELAAEQRKRQWVLITAVSIGLLLVIAFAIFIFNRFKMSQKQKGIIEMQKELVDEKNKEITDSIQYAKRIQSAILPPQKLVQKYLKECFILYKPKDIVAGDFYWIEPQGSKVIFTAADCTGHGVPGAMVSVLCSNALTKSVKEMGLTQPAEILNQTGQQLEEKFESSEEEVRDGMDLALCCLDTDKNILQYAGANNPLWVIRKNGELQEIKPDPQPIGKHENRKPFTNHELQLNKGDTIYIFSDGYPDQFGGPRGRKFMYAQFKEMLFKMQDKPMAKQKEILDTAFEDWKGEQEQTDDVCVIGVKIQ